MRHSPGKITDLLVKLNGTNQAAVAAELMPLVYDQLRELAGRYFRHERRGHTLQPTALVHEAYLRLLEQTRIDWQGRTQFFAVAAVMMRRVLVDYARAQQRARRGGGRCKMQLDSHNSPVEGAECEVLAVHEALEHLAVLDERGAKVVEMRFFGGLTMEEIAAALGVSKRTVENDWKHAKVWLRSEFAAGSKP